MVLPKIRGKHPRAELCQEPPWERRRLAGVFGCQFIVPMPLTACRASDKVA